MARKKDKGFSFRLRYAVIPSLLLCFMYILWGPMEVFVGNAANFRFSYVQAAVPLALLCAAATLALAALLALLPRRLFNAALCLLIAFTVASYVQKQFLNLDLGLLEGVEIDWRAYDAHAVWNLIIWAALLIALPTALLLACGRRVPQVCAAAAGLMLLVQAGTFAIVSVQHLSSDANRSGEPVYVLSGEEQYHVSANSNVIVFLLDYFSNDYIDRMSAQFPDAMAPFHDFTYYDNCDPNYIGTFPSVVHLLTGEPFDPSVRIDEWFRTAWGSDSARYFYRTLAEKNYKFNFFDASTTYFGISYAEPYVSNLVKTEASEATVRYPLIVKLMLQLSLYQHLPHVFKEDLVLSTADFYHTVSLRSDTVPTCYTRNAFYNVLRAEGLTAVDDGNYFIIEFLRGTHPPYEINEFAAWDETATLEECAAGNMRIVAAYLEQLQSLGLYDEATIIITSDHGDKENSMQVLYLIKEPGVRREEMAVSSAPITHGEFIGTILRNIGTEYPYGQSIYDFADGERRERTIMRNYIDPSYPKTPKYHSTGTGTHNVMYAYTYTGARQALRLQLRRGPTEILPLCESFN